MAEALQGWRGSKEGAQWQQDRARLPVRAIRQDLLSQLAQQDVVVVSGDTGCGKTTQVPSASCKLRELKPALADSGMMSICNCQQLQDPQELCR